MHADRCSIRLSRLARVSRLVSLLVLAAGLSSIFWGCESDLARELSSYEKARDYDAAKDMLRQEIQQNPSNEAAHYHLGRILFREGSYEEGMSAFETSRDDSPRYEEEIEFQVEKYHREELIEGTDALEDGELEQAVSHFQAATKIKPNDARSHRGLGHTLVELERQDAAEEAYREAERIDPGHVETLNNLAHLTFNREAFEETIEYSREALDAGEPRLEVVKRLGYAHVQLGQLQEAEERLDQALGLGASPEVRRDYALILFNQEKYEAAVRELNTLTTEAGELDLELLRAQAESQFALESYEEAAQLNNQILERAEGDQDALQNLAILYDLLGEYDQAKGYREQLDQSNDADE